jgi:hypothetical protein
MYRQESAKQQKLEDFYLPFGGHLNARNRWVQELIPWDEFEEQYAEQFAESGQGAVPCWNGGYKDEALFDLSMMTHFRTRITEEMLSEINETIHEAHVKKTPSG